MGEHDDAFTFEFSLTVLNHLGRQLYRNFITIIGEAVSNSWDADATHVSITMDEATNTMTITDDGHGMTSEDIQNKFLKIGYSKRKDTNSIHTPHGRPYIGAKGIGKLALLSCADQVTVISKTRHTPTDGCIIDNSVLDDAIAEDKDNTSVPLPRPDAELIDSFGSYDSGTQFIFTNLRPQRSTPQFLRKAIAMFFRFSLLDEAFTISFNGTPITASDNDALANSTEYLWKLGSEYSDPFLDLIHPVRHATLDAPHGVRGFIASVEKPRNLEVLGAGARVGIDLFVNGRLRERNVFEQHPTSRIPEQYLYGQIHYDALDNDITADPFTSSREGIVEGNTDYQNVLEQLVQVRNDIINQWDEWRLADKKEGDPENSRKTKASRAAHNLTRELESRLRKDSRTPQLTNTLIAQAAIGSADNAESYTYVYLLENYLRQIINHYHLQPTGKRAEKTKRLIANAREDQQKAGLDKPCRLNNEVADYFGLADLLTTAKAIGSDRNPTTNTQPHRGKIIYLRDALMHTAHMSSYAHGELRGTCDVIRGMINIMVADKEASHEDTTQPDA